MINFDFPGKEGKLRTPMTLTMP